MNLHHIQLSPLARHLVGRDADRLVGAVGLLEAGIAAGMIRNVDFNDAKDALNRAVEEGAEAFLKTCPTRNHHMGDWWKSAYDAGAFVHGASNVASALKRAQKAGDLTEYAEFLASLMPLVGLLAAAKPLIVKRQDQPKVVSPKQTAKLAKSMTCQCCGRAIFAETGVIAHHGYQRPGGGWQTASCSGARELPFEVSREALGRLIESLRRWEATAVEDRAAVEAETAPVVVFVSDRSQPRDNVTGRYPTKRVELTRSTDVAATGLKGTFDDYKVDDLRARARDIDGVRDEIKAQQARFDGWKQTHSWDATANTWKAA